MYGAETNLNSQTENCVLLKKLIVTADDLRLTRRVNEAIGKAHREGVVTTASLMVNGAAFESAVDMLEHNPSLDAGLHLNLTEGAPVSAPAQISTLADSAGFVYRSPFALATGLLRRKVLLADLETEIRAQLEKALAAGVPVSHVDGHKHVHVIPQVFDLICRISPDYGIRAVRSTIERTPKLVSLLARNVDSCPQILKQYVFGKGLSGAWLLKQPAKRHRILNTPRRFYGITQTGFLDIATFSQIVSGLKSGVSEVMCHPGYVDDDLIRTPTRLHFQRERELELLTGSEIRDLLKRAGVALISYRDLVDLATHV